MENPTHAPDSAVPPAAATMTTAAGPVGRNRSWIGDARRAVQMFFDPRYRMTWQCRLGVPALGVLLLANYVCFNWAFSIPVLSPLAERLILFGLGLVLYKMLGRERERYQAVLDYLEQMGRTR